MCPLYISLPHAVSSLYRPSSDVTGQASPDFNGGECRPECSNNCNGHGCKVHASYTAHGMPPMFCLSPRGRGGCCLLVSVRSRCGFFHVMCLCRLLARQSVSARPSSASQRSLPVPPPSAPPPPAPPPPAPPPPAPPPPALASGAPSKGCLSCLIQTYSIRSKATLSFLTHFAPPPTNTHSLRDQHEPERVPAKVLCLRPPWLRPGHLVPVLPAHQLWPQLHGVPRHNGPGQR